MHSVNTKKNRVIALRVTAYAATIILSIITTILLLFVSLGYRFNAEEGIIQSGLLLVDSKPEAGKIYINGELKDNQTPGRFVLPVGDYELSLERANYRGWKKQIPIRGEAVERVAYPLLIPTKLTTSPLLEITKPQMVSQSLDNKQLLYFVDGETVLHRIELDAKSPKSTELALSSAFSKESGSIGTLRVIEWSLNNRFALIEQKLPSGQTSVVSLEVAKPDEAVNLTKKFGATPLGDPHYVGGKTDEIYALNEGVLRRYAINDGTADVVLQRVQSYSPYGDKTIAYTRLSEDSLSIEAAIVRDKTTATLQTVPVSSNMIVNYSEYDKHGYMAVSSNESVVIYRDPLNKPILAKQLPFVTLPLAGAQYIRFSPNSQFVVLQNGSNFLTYDFENKHQSAFKISGEIVGANPRWMNDSHLQYQSVDGMNYLTEFDNQNSSVMVGSDVGTRLYYSADQRSAYRLITGTKGTQLELVPLTAE